MKSIIREIRLIRQKAQNRILKIPFTSEMVEDAAKKASDLGCINKSILCGAGNFAGYLGEEALAAYIDAQIISVDDGGEKYSYDLAKGNKRIEVKTKRRTVRPRLEYDVSVAKASKHQKPDIYAFISLEFARCNGIHPREYHDLRDIWLCGFISANEFWEKAEAWDNGRVDSTNGFTTHVDMYNMPIRRLYSFDKLKC